MDSQAIDRFSRKAEPRELSRRKQLFLDMEIVSRCEGVSQTMHTPEKWGPLLRPVPDEGEVSLQSRNSPQWNPDKSCWEWHYWGMHECPPYGQWHSTQIGLCKYAVSRDGLDWERPELGLFEYDVLRKNNLSMDPALGHRSLYHCLRDDVDPDPARRYKGLMGQHNRGLAVSADGFSWKTLPDVQLKSSDESSFSYDPYTGQFIAAVKGGTHWGRSMYLMTSKDFVNWDDHGVIIHADGDDWNGHMDRLTRVIESPAFLSPPLVDEDGHHPETYNAAILPYEGQYVALVNIFDPAGAIPPPQMNHTGLNQIGLAASRDLLHWRRLGDRELFLGVSPWDGFNYDTQQLLPCGPPVVTDEEIRIYYNACRFRGHKELFPEEYHPYFTDISALNLATLRLDGFVSVTAQSSTGSMMTKPFNVHGSRLLMNCDASVGAISVQVLDGETLALLAESHPVTEDGLRIGVNWQDDDFTPEPDQPVRLRFLITDAHLYSFWSE